MAISRATRSGVEIAGAAVLALFVVLLVCPNVLADADPASPKLRLTTVAFCPFFRAFRRLEAVWVLAT
jgi:hypothetical protein